jgi:hypothetical protein
MKASTPWINFRFYLQIFIFRMGKQKPPFIEVAYCFKCLFEAYSVLILMNTIYTNVYLAPGPGEYLLFIHKALCGIRSRKLFSIYP